MILEGPAPLRRVAVYSAGSRTIFAIPSAWLDIASLTLPGLQVVVHGSLGGGKSIISGEDRRFDYAGEGQTIPCFGATGCNRGRASDLKAEVLVCEDVFT